MKVAVVAAILGAALVSGCAGETGNSVNSLVVGNPVVQPLRVGDKVAPLPDGQWIVAASERSYSTLGTPIANVVLLNVAKGAEVLTAVVSTNLVKSNGAYWKLPSACFRHDMLFVDGLQNYSQERHKCWYVNHIILGRNSRTSASTRHAYDMAHQRGIPIPAVGLYAYFHEADDTDEFSVGYLFNPAAVGIPAGREASWITSDWHPDRITASAQRKAYVDKLIRWGRSWWPQIDDGFFGRVVRSPLIASPLRTGTR